MKNYDTIIVGGGITGCSTALALAEQGSRVLLLEKDRIASLQGSSHGQSRIIRLSYGDTRYIALCRAVYPLWRELEAQSGTKLLETTGVLDLRMRPAKSWISTRNAMTDASVPFDILDKAALERRFPQFCVADGVEGLYQPDAGVLHADLCLDLIASKAREAGAILKEGEEAIAIEHFPDRVSVRTDRETYRCDRLVLAAGPQMGELTTQLGLDLPLKVTKEQVAFFVPDDKQRFSPAKGMPVFIMHFGDNILGSGFPLIREVGLKLMVENKIPATEGEFSVNEALLQRLKEIVRDLLPELNNEPVRAETCRYTITPDEDFIIGCHPKLPNVVLASACSGHGFKFAPLFGRTIANLCLGREPGIDLSLFDPQRWR